MQKPLHTGHFHSIPFFHKWSVGDINFTCKLYKMKNDKTYSKVSMVWQDLHSIMPVHKW